jgi:hypothetical protein
LPSNEKVERDFGYKKGLPGPVGVTNGCPDVIVREAVKGAHGLKEMVWFSSECLHATKWGHVCQKNYLKAPAKNLCEDVADPRSSKEFVHLNSV